MATTASYERKYKQVIKRAERARAEAAKAIKPEYNRLIKESDANGLRSLGDAVCGVVDPLCFHIAVAEIEIKRVGWAAATKNVLPKLAEIDYDQIDKRMRPLIRLLRDNQFSTLACCEGGKGHPHEKAWIRLTINDERVERIPMFKFPVGMGRWYIEFERLAKFVYTKTNWPCEVKIFTFAAFGDSPKAKKKMVHVCLDIEFEGSLRSCMRF